MTVTLKRFFSIALIMLFAVSLLPGLAPQSPAGAQDDPDDRRILFERMLASLSTADTYTSYEATVASEWEQIWSGTLGDYAEGQHQTVSITKQVATATTPELSIQDQTTLTETLLYNEQPVLSYTMEGELRQVGGTSYVQAQYVDAAGNDLPRIPDDWIVLSDPMWFDLYPGLGIVINSTVYPANATDVSTLRRLIDLDLASTPPEAIEALLSTITSATTTLDDGREVEAISATFVPAAVLALNIFGAGDDPLVNRIVEAIQQDPVTATVFLDEDDRLLGLDLDVHVDVDDLLLSGVPGVPAGYVLTIEFTQTRSLRFESIDQPVVAVSAPEIAVPAAYARPAPPTEMPWWNDRVFYEVFVRSFYDSDGNSKGDLRGLIDRLDYLNDGDPATTDDLGITGIWLMPIAQSPSYHGYDVTDYWTVETDYGTNADFQELVAAAHKRGIAIIIDLVLNHTSSEHPWFLASQQGDPAYEDFYIWADEPGTFNSPWGAPVWHASGDRYYYGLFWSGMPDLNYNNPAVTVEMYDIIWYWLEDMGADGFRLDAIRHLFEDGPVLENTPETLAWLEAFNMFVHDVKPGALTIGEIWDSSAEIAPYVPEKVDIAFEFDLAQAMLLAAQHGHNLPLIDAMSTIRELYPTGQYATFLTNHDQNRVMSQLAGDEGAARVAASLLLTSPGVPFIYYGEEVGMVGEKPDERIRTPMQWDDSTGTAGFSTVLPWQRVSENYRTHNVAAMTDDPDSLLAHYRRLVHLRSEHPALQTGTFQLVETGNLSVYSFVRYSADETILVLVNLGSEVASDYALTIREGLLASDVMTEVLLAPGDAAPDAPTITDAGGFDDYQPLPTLPAQSTTIIRFAPGE